MSDENDDDVSKLERQVERGSLFTHTALSRNAEETHDAASFAYGLVDLLVAKGLVTREEVLGAAQNVREQMEERGETIGPGVALRVDAPPEPGREIVLVNCAERMPVCKAICCKLTFALTREEVEAGYVKWDLGIPYQIRQEPNGACTHQATTGACGVYENRPGICRRYSCAGDTRIWKDFEGMVLNDEWLREHLGGTTPRLVTARMIPQEVLARAEEREGE